MARMELADPAHRPHQRLRSARPLHQLIPEIHHIGDRDLGSSIASRTTVAARSASIGSGEPPGKLNWSPVSCTNTRPASSTNQPYT